MANQFLFTAVTSNLEVVRKWSISIDYAALM